MKIRCMGCMETFSDEFEICPHCGYIVGTAAKEANHMPPNTLIADRYIVGKVLGYGGFGVTYIGWDKLLKEKVAIKEYLPGEYATRMPGQTAVTVYSGEKTKQFQEGKDKFSDEAKRLAKVGNIESVVQVIDTLDVNETAYIVMEYLEGETLKERLKREERIAVEEAIKIIVPILDTLDKVHAEKILHRDISPDNIFLCTDGRIKLLDFGAARYASTNYSKSLSVLLKSGYAPEEQYRSRGEQGAWSDVYAAAATLYRMITGIVPEDALERTVKDTVKEPHKIDKTIPKNVSTAIMNALNVYQKSRTQSAEAFKKELLSAQEVARRKDEIVKNQKPIPFWLKLGGVAVVLLTVGIAIFAGQGTKDVLEDGQTYIPDVVNLTDDEASDIAKENGLVLQIAEGQYDDKVERGRIVSQDPGAGQVVEEKSSFNAVMSKGPEPVKVPSLIGKTEEKAIARLEKAELLFEVEKKESAALPGTVYSQSEDEGTAIPKGEIIKLSVSEGISDINKKKKTTVPTLKGMSYTQGLKEAKDSKVYVEVTELKFSSSEKNQIISQSVKSGKKVKEGTKIEIVVSKGVRDYIVPDVQYLTKKAAIKALKKEELHYKVKYQYSKTYKKGVVMEQSIEAGKKVKDDTVVTIVVSKGKKVTMVTVPSVLGKSRSSAVAAIENAGFNCNVIEEYSSTYEKGKVCAVSHEGGVKEKKGATIRISISKGPEMTTVPDVTTLSESEAVAVLDSEGLRCSISYRDKDGYSGSVINQSISPGTKVKTGTTVRITVGR